MASKSPANYPNAATGSCCSPVGAGRRVPNNLYHGTSYPELLGGNVGDLRKRIMRRNDRDPALVNVGSTTPSNSRVQQLP